jgi:glycerol-3-phosphate acyltransferase PlsY
MTWIVILLSYLIGSIPVAYLAGRLIQRRDIRQFGDGNVGARNAYQHLGHRTGVAIFFIDVSKGLLAIVIARAAGLSQAGVFAAGALAVIGHNWPVFLGFRGGRGESVTIGVLLALVPIPVLIAAVPSLTGLFTRKSVMLASILLFIPLPLACWWQGVSLTLIIYSIGLPCLVGFTHFLREKQLATHRAHEHAGIKN